MLGSNFSNDTFLFIIPIILYSLLIIIVCLLYKEEKNKEIKPITNEIKISKKIFAVIFIVVVVFIRSFVGKIIHYDFEMNITFIALLGIASAFGKFICGLFKDIFGRLKENMIPTWYDVLTKEYVFEINEKESQYFWLEELKEYEKYYEMHYEIEEILEYDGKICKGVQKYVDTYYKIKNSSKGAVKNGAKLFLNSAYGKLAERVEKIECNYEISEGGYMHLVKGKETIDEKSLMSVLLGSRITALARVQLMEYILEICKGNPKKYFVYCDTDSVHALCDYENTDDKKLGMMKNEGIYEFGKYLAPKSYLLYHNIVENKYEYEVHTKGVNVNVVKEELEKCKDFYQASEKFKAGITYKCLTSLNCIGGKALVYIDKMILNPKMAQEQLEDDELID